MIAYRTRYIPFQNKYYHNNNNKQHKNLSLILLSLRTKQKK